MINVTIEGKKIKLEKPAQVKDLFDNKDRKIIGCRVNNTVRSLVYYIEKDSNIELFELASPEGSRMYEASMRYIVAMAAKNVLPKAKICYNYSVSRSIFASVSNIGHAFTYDNFMMIKKEVERLISLDLPINYIKKTKEELIEYYDKIGYHEKNITLIKYEPRKKLSLYECDGYMNYMYNPLVSSTGFLQKYILRQYAPGFLISYPRFECKGEIPPMEDERAFRAALKEANKWANTIKNESISQLNNLIEDGKALELINLCETRHNTQFTHLGDKIEDHIDNIKVICVAGPSSSGKTTFTNRLKIELKSRGIEPFMISMDNFYKISDYPLDENGIPDLEHINALNLDLFDQTMLKLVSGEATRLPIFDFEEKKITFTEPKKLNKKQPILLEGIHGLNPEIIPSIPEEEKFRIYIAPLGQYRYDIHNPLSISDLRLMRRIVRDHQFRNTDADKTIKAWSSVRNGEFKWIYPYQNNADFVFNSELSYEVPVLKNMVVPLLEAVERDSSSFNTARRLLKFLGYFLDITEKWVPSSSILREFIGDSIFYTEDKK